MGIYADLFATHGAGYHLFHHHSVYFVVARHQKSEQCKRETLLQNEQEQSLVELRLSEARILHHNHKSHDSGYYVRQCLRVCEPFNGKSALKVFCIKHYQTEYYH